MALIKCENCGKDISDRAIKCPHCGHEKNTTAEVPAVQSIICEECGSEIPPDAKACPFCGCPVNQFEEETTPQKVEITKVSVNKKTKKILLYVLAALVAIGAIIGIATASKAAQAEKAAEAAKANYIQNLATVRLSMLLGAAEAERTSGLIHDVWYNSIYEKRDSVTDKYTRPKGYFVSDFNTALSNLLSDSVYTTSKETIKDNQNSTAELMKELLNPPEEYKEAYSVLKDLYEAYTDLCNCAVNPQGNLSSYTSKFNEADQSFMKYYDALELYIK